MPSTICRVNTQGCEPPFDPRTQETLASIERLGVQVRLGATGTGGNESGLVFEVTRSVRTPDAILAELQSIHAAYRLVLRGSRTTDAGIRRLAASDALRAVEIHKEPRLTPLCLEYLPRTIRELVLSGGQIDDDWLLRAGKLRQLVRLELSNTRISDQGLRLLSGLDQLEVLGLRNTDTSDKGLKFLHRLRALRMLSLEGTYCTAAGVAALRSRLDRVIEIPPWS